MQFGTGFGGSVVSGLYGGGGSPGSAGQAAQPAATSGPTGSPTLMAAAWGTGGDAEPKAGQYASWIGAGCWVALAFIWWSLPRLGGGKREFLVGSSGRRRRHMGIPPLG